MEKPSASEESCFIGIDIGGTYTDLVIYHEAGAIDVLKVPSIPADPSKGAVKGIALLDPPEGFEVIHGSTVGTNAILERKGVRTALVVTKGFADIQRIGRQTRQRLYALDPENQKPLIPDEMVFPVRERVNGHGEIVQALGDDEVASLFRKLKKKKVHSLALCLMFSFLSDSHEQKIASFSEAKDYSVSLSSEILCEFREYERCSTTALNAYIAPLMKYYLEGMGRKVASLGAKSLWIMQSNGGIFSVEEASKRPVHTILSGPAAGVAGAWAVASVAGFNEIITLDMGGTSTDVSLCESGLPLTREGSLSGYPVRIPILDIHTIGSGGGSIARVDEGGVLKVGPQSAGADPGPACFGKGTAATVTDAHMELGRLPDSEFIQGIKKPFPQRARQSLEALAVKIGSDTRHTAWGVLQVAQAQMEGALRVVSLQRGHDPRRFTLVPFGGAGPLQACELAASLEIPQVLIPRYPGVLSALGMIAAPQFMEFSRTIRMPLEEASPEILKRHFADLEKRAKIRGNGDHRTLHSLDMRFRGQSFELMVPVREFSGESLKEDFLALHQRRYGYVRAQADIEIVNFLLRIERKPSIQNLTLTSRKRSIRKMQHGGIQKVWWSSPGNTGVLMEKDFHLISRESLMPGDSIAGPAIITQYDCTTIVPPFWGGMVDDFENVILKNPDVGS
jgi:N-methylhydantoinase A